MTLEYMLNPVESPKELIPTPVVLMASCALIPVFFKNSCAVFADGEAAMSPVKVNGNEVPALTVMAPAKVKDVAPLATTVIG